QFSPSAYTSGLCPTRPNRRVSPLPNHTMRTCRPLYPGRTPHPLRKPKTWDMAFAVTCAARLLHCFYDEAAGLAPEGTTARTLAPSKEALDTPLSPPPLSNEPGSATGRSDTYPDGTSTRRRDPASWTQHGLRI